MLLASGIMFLLASYLYIANRDGNMSLYSWLGIEYNNSFFVFLRYHSFKLAPWIKYNLPDGLWLLSFLISMEALWGKEKYIKLLFCTLMIVFAYGLEIMQFCGIFPGTGDIIDIYSYTITIIIFLLLTKLKQIYYEKNI